MFSAKFLEECFNYACYLKDDKDFLELSNDIKELINAIATKSVHEANELAEILVDKYRNELDGIVRINNCAPVRTKIQNNNIPTVEENALVILESLIKLLIKKILENYCLEILHSYNINFGNNIETIVNMIKLINGE